MITMLILFCSDGDFITIVDLPEGEHQYKFVVDGKWEHDPNQVNDCFLHATKLLNLCEHYVRLSLVLKLLISYLFIHSFINLTFIASRLSEFSFIYLKLIRKFF